MDNISLRPINLLENEMPHGEFMKPLYNETIWSFTKPHLFITVKFKHFLQSERLPRDHFTYEVSVG